MEVIVILEIIIRITRIKSEKYFGLILDNINLTEKVIDFNKYFLRKYVQISQNVI